MDNPTLPSSQIMRGCWAGEASAGCLASCSNYPEPQCSPAELGIDLRSQKSKSPKSTWRTDPFPSSPYYPWSRAQAHQQGQAVALHTHSTTHPDSRPHSRRHTGNAPCPS
jgi:hypothetical protein